MYIVVVLVDVNWFFALCFRVWSFVSLLVIVLGLYNLASFTMFCVVFIFCVFGCVVFIIRVGLFFVRDCFFVMCYQIFCFVICVCFVCR